MNEFRIDNRQIGADNPCFIIAELSANHNGSLDNAVATIKAAKRAGADAIKIQTFTPDTITLNHRSEDFKLTQGTIWDGKYLYDLYAEAYTPWEWHRKLFEVANDEGLICFSSPFDPSSVELLQDLDAPAYKIASFEITDIPLIELVAGTGKPVLISTGIARQEDIQLAVDTCRAKGNYDIALLKCTSSYPAPVDEANMIMVKDLSERFEVVSGLSDHTIGHTVPVVAVCFGAKIIEKHFIIDRSIGGPDASFSMNESEFSEMVLKVREAEKAVGKIDYNLTEKQTAGRAFSRSLYVVEDIRKGEAITKENVRSIRPGYGMHPKYYHEVLGRSVGADLRKGTPLSWDLIR